MNIEKIGQIIKKSAFKIIILTHTPKNNYNYQLSASNVKRSHIQVVPILIHRRTVHPFSDATLKYPPESISPIISSCASQQKTLQPKSVSVTWRKSSKMLPPNNPIASSALKVPFSCCCPKFKPSNRKVLCISFSN